MKIKLSLAASILLLSTPFSIYAQNDPISSQSITMAAPQIRAEAQAEIQALREAYAKQAKEIASLSSQLKRIELAQVDTAATASDATPTTSPVTRQTAAKKNIAKKKPSNKKKSTKKKAQRKKPVRQQTAARPRAQTQPTAAVTSERGQVANTPPATASQTENSSNNGAPATGTTATQSGQGNASTAAKAAKVKDEGLQRFTSTKADFIKGLTIENGFSYTRYDRRQLILNGFLALDAIFLGDINLSRIEADTFTYNLGFRYGVNSRLQFNINLPFVYRSTEFQQTGNNQSTAQLQSTTLDNSPNLGDVSAGMSFELHKESPKWPSLVWSLGFTAPTGTSPYGIKQVDKGNANNPFLVPSKMPTGNGIWALNTGLSVLRTLDPVVLFANLGYTYNFEQNINDLSTAANTTQAGSIKIGDIYQFGLGMAVALNERVAMNLSYTQAISDKSQSRTAGQRWQSIIDSGGVASTLNLGSTLAITRHLSMVANVGAGLTPDAPDVAFNLQFPYNFG